MNRQKFTIRLPTGLAAAVTRQAAERGLTRTTWVTHLVERGLLAESSERWLEALEARRDGAPAAAARAAGEGTSLPGWERMVFLGCFATAMLKALNAALTRSPVELGRIAAAARDQAEAETRALLKG